MNNVTLDSTGFTEQLGLYDFFNVILSGAVFVLGLCAISQDLSSFLWSGMSIPKGLGLVLFIYILGMLLQEIGSIADKYLFKIYKRTNQSVLKGREDPDYKYEVQGGVISNPITLKRYRDAADKLLIDDQIVKDNNRYDNNLVNGYVFSACQYYVSVCGKDQKVEKLRALFAMSKTLISCFFILSIVAFISILTKSAPNGAVVNVLSLSGLPYTACGVKVILALLFAIIGVLFIFRAKRTMKNFLLILMGTYYALVCGTEAKGITSDAKPQKAADEVKTELKV